MTLGWIVLPIGYLLGSIPTSVIVGRVLGGIDVREHGSGNAGASNVLRLLGWKAGLFVLAMDVAKGWLAVELATRVGPSESWVPQTAGLLAVAGHLWPVFAAFRGGKGVATAAGAVLALYPKIFLAAALLFVLAVVITRRIAVGSLVAAIAVPLLLALAGGLAGRPPDTADYAFAGSVAVAILAAHHTNIANLWRGTEPRIGHRGS